jgi:hypothetical protein
VEIACLALIVWSVWMRRDSEAAAAHPAPDGRRDGERIGVTP